MTVQKIIELNAQNGLKFEERRIALEVCDVIVSEIEHIFGLLTI